MNRESPGFSHGELSKHPGKKQGTLFCEIEGRSNLLKPLSAIKLNRKIQIIETGADGGACRVKMPDRLSLDALVIFSWGGGWDHVSVSFPNRCPSWDEMCRIKDMFFDEDECVVQYHPPKQDYVNRHPYCLHLWRPQSGEIMRPPKEMVG